MHSRKIVEDLFIAAADLPCEDRSAWLDKACGGDAVLRREVESLLAYDAGESQLLSHVVQQSAVLLMDGEPVAGLRIGPWRVTESLGRGGMGAVYLAVRDDDQFTKQVAIKFIRRGMDTPAVVDRFVRERQILASLDHPYIAKLIDGGATADGVPYIVMEYVRGTPVDRWCDERRPTLEQRCDLFRKICEAVAYAHRNLIVHRDLKPTNILVTGDGTPMLLDFGIAKLIDDAASMAKTATANWVLTPDYASPEQIRGRATTTATDVYSLGMVFYQLLTGARPYDVTSTSPVEVARTVCEQQPARPSSIRRDRKLSGDLDNIILMALRKEPERRYSSVEQFSEDVRRYLCGLPVIAREDTFGYRARKFVSRNRAAVVAAGLTGVSLIAAAGISTMEARRAGQARAIAEDQRREATMERDRAEREHLVANQQRDAAAKASAEAVAHAKEADTQRKRAEARVADLVELGNRSLLDVQNTLARIPGALEARKTVVQSTLQYLDNLRETSGNDPEVLAVLVSGYTSIGDVLGLPLRPNLGDRKGAVDAYDKARALLAKLTKMQPADPRVRLQTIGLYQRSGVVYESEGDVERALTGYRAGLAVAEKLAHDFPTQAQAVVQIGIMEHQLSLTMTSRDVAEAELHARREIAAYERVATMDSAKGPEGLTGAHSSLARVFAAQERPAEAAAEYGIALSRAEALLAMHPSDGIALAAVANFCSRLAIVHGATWQPGTGDKVAALAYAERSIAIYRDLAAADKTSQKGAFDLAEALAYAGAIENSVDRLQSAVSVLDKLVQSSPRQLHAWIDLAFAREYLGRARRSAGDTAGSLEDYRKSLEALRVIGELAPGDSAGHMQAVATRQAMSEALAANGDRGQALDTARQVLDLVHKTSVAMPPRIKPLTLAWVGDTFRDARDIPSACAAWREAEATERDSRRLESLRAKLATCR